jgi:hypothetical protein
MAMEVPSEDQAGAPKIWMPGPATCRTPEPSVPRGPSWSAFRCSRWARCRSWPWRCCLFGQRPYLGKGWDLQGCPVVHDLEHALLGVVRGTERGQGGPQAGSFWTPRAWNSPRRLPGN